MSGTSPNFAYLKKFATYSIWEAACLISGFDPRAMTDVTDEYGGPVDLYDEIKQLISAVYAGNLALALEQNAPFTQDTLVRGDSLIEWLNKNGYKETAYSLGGDLEGHLSELAHEEPIGCLLAVIEGNRPASQAVVGFDQKYPWTKNAREIAEELLSKDKALTNKNQLQIAAKVAEEMTRRKKNGKEGMTGRGNRVPSAETIKRHALNGLVPLKH